MVNIPKEPLDLQLDSRANTTGVIMCDQVKSPDVHNRRATFLKSALKDLIAEAADLVVSVIEAILEIL